jgi:hypothetical protein
LFETAGTAPIPWAHSVLKKGRAQPLAVGCFKDTSLAPSRIALAHDLAIHLKGGLELSIVLIQTLYLLSHFPHQPDQTPVPL